MLYISSRKNMGGLHLSLWGALKSRCSVKSFLSKYPCQELVMQSIKTRNSWQNSLTWDSLGQVVYKLGGGLVGVSQNVDNNNFGHFIYIYKDLILHHLQWFFYKSTIYPSKCTNLQATIYNNLTSLVYTLQREFGPNLQSTK